MSSDRKSRVEEHAYKIWEQEGRPHGRDKDHWHRAERDLADQPASKHAPGASEAEAMPDAAVKAQRKAAPKEAKPATKPAKAKGEPKAAKSESKPAKTMKGAKPKA